jgi:hypothetical protein
MERDYHPIEDSDKWEIYVKYRKIVSQFLTSTNALTDDALADDALIDALIDALTEDLYTSGYQASGPRRHSSISSLLVSPQCYVSFAEYLLHFLSEDLW